GIDARPSRPAPRTAAPASAEAFAMPAGDSGRLDKHQRVLPPRPPPSQAQPEQAVRWAEASVGTSEHAQLVAQGEILEDEVSTRSEGRPECGDPSEGLAHRG